jgi:ATP-dependent 26S proteasome regulatory subunit
LDNGFTISIITTNEEKGLKLKNDLEPFFKQEGESQGRVKMLATSPNGVELIDIGRVDQELVQDNYEEEVQNAYEFIKEDLCTSTPSGRIILLDGEPGTGKSFFIRGLVSEIDAWFVYVPAGMVGGLSGPNMVKVLNNSDRGNDDKKLPLILIVEDADTSLVKRAKGDKNQLAELLNMSDGIFGELADIRIIASTNASRMEIDDAIVRPGRLSKHVHFDKLSAGQASGVYKRLTGNDLEDGKPHTLAEVYRMARQDGWTPPKIKEESYGNYA